MLPASLLHSPWEKGATLDDCFAVPQYCLSLLDQTLPFGLWVCDLAGGVCYLSPSFLEVLGMEMQQCRRQGWLAAIAPEDADLTLEKWRTSLRELKPWCHEFHIRSRDGKLRRVLGRGAPVRGHGGEPLAWAGVNIDITEHRRAEESERRREERRRMSQRLEVIGRLAGGVAHDFNNLLTAINGYGELLAAMMGDHEGAAYAREIVKAGEKAAQLTRQLLAFSRRQIQAPRVLDLNQMMRGLRDALQGIAGGNVDVTVEAAASRARVKADPAQLEQVVLNLVFNAREAMPRGGQLLLRIFDAAPPAEAAEGPAAECGYVGLSVRDTGEGMDEDTLEHLFEPFYSTKGRAQGLGLPAVYGIVRQNGGHIAVASRKGEGTEVRIHWPLWEAEKPDRPVAQPCVLVAEDDEAVRKLVRGILEEKGYAVIVARSAEEALEVCRRGETPIDLLLADVVMPGMSGVELAEAVQPLRPTMKVLFMSSYLNLQAVRQEVLASTHAFIGKPFSPGDLTGKVRDVLEMAAAA